MNKSPIVFFIAVTALLFVAINRVYFSHVAIWEIPSLINGVRAKEFCTCYYIMGKGEDYCIEAVNHGYPMMAYEINEKNKAVRFDFLWSSRLAMIELPCPRIGSTTPSIACSIWS